VYIENFKERLSGSFSHTTMAHPVAKIRSYAANDRKLVQFMVSKSNMEALAVANNRSALPLTLVCLCTLFFLGLESLLPPNNAFHLGCPRSCFRAADELVAD